MASENILHRNFLKRLHAGSITADTNSASIDCLDAEQVAIAVVFGATTGSSATATLILQDSADDSTFAAVTGATTAALTLDSGGQTNKVYVFQVNTDRLRRYLRINVDVNGTSPVTGATTAIFAVTGSLKVTKTTADYDGVVKVA